MPLLAGNSFCPPPRPLPPPHPPFVSAPCLQVLLLEQPGAGSAQFLQGQDGDELSSQPAAGRQAPALAAAGAQLKVAWVLAGD